MEDSSSNPYIPQESEAIRQKVYEHQSPLGKVAKWSLIITVIVAVLVGAGLFFVVPRTTADDQESRIKLADALQPPSETQKRIGVESTLGFTLNYDNLVYSSYAEVGDSSSGSDNSAAMSTGETYENNELRVHRAYNYVRIRPIESVEAARALAPLPPELEIFATVSEADLTKAAVVPENKGLSKLSLFVKIDGDKRAAKKVADDKTVVSIEATKPTTMSIGGTSYQKVRYTTTNENHRISNVKYDECYYTIQNDQPYTICVSGVRPTNVSAASLVEQVLNTLQFKASSIKDESEPTPDDAQTTSSITPSIRLVQADTTKTTDDTASTTTDEQSPLLTVKPMYYTDKNALMAIAKTQPSVVRVATLYCANLALKLESGDTATTLTNSCTGNVASGVFVSKDGYIATTGHAVRELKKKAIGGYINFSTDKDQMLDHLQRVLDYLLKSKIILQSDADYITNGAQVGDQEALAKIQNIGSVIPDDFITPLNEEYQYAVQPTDKPIVVNRTDTSKPSFAYSDSVLEAKHIVSDYDATKSKQEDFGSVGPAKDVALLKVNDDFQEVSIANDVTIKANDKLSTIGFPAYTDSSLTTDKTRNKPVVTSSTVEQVYDKDGGKLVQTDTPVLPGNDGAPVFDSNGLLVGFAVYGLSYCPDQECFANGTIRTVSELTSMLNKNNIRLDTGSVASQKWQDGVDQYFRANYTASTDAFAAAANAYAFNPVGESVQKLSASLEGSDKDTSTMNLIQLIMIVVLVILGFLTVILSLALVVDRRRISQLRVGHYGNEQAAPSQLPPVYPSQTPYQQPVQTAYQPSPQMGQDQTIQNSTTPPANNYYPPQPMPNTPPTNPDGFGQNSVPPQQPPVQGEDPFYKQ